MITNFDQAAEPATPTERDKRWQGCCRLAVNLLHSNQIAQFVTDLHAGRVPQVTEPAMMTAAISLVSGMSGAGVKRWDWLPAPSVEELADPAAWAERRLAERRVVQDEAERIRRQQQKVARAFGQPPSGGSGTINPVYLQKLKYSLEELARRLEQAMSKEGFRREDLDHRSPNYISCCQGRHQQQTDRNHGVHDRGPNTALVRRKLEHRHRLRKRTPRQESGRGMKDLCYG